MSDYVQPPLPGMPTIVDLDGTGMDLVKTLVTAKRAIDLWENVREEARATLIKLLTGGEDAPEGSYPGAYRGKVVVAATRFAEQRFDSKAFHEDHPDLYATYRKQILKTLVVPAKSVIVGPDGE